MNKVGEFIIKFFKWLFGKVEWLFQQFKPPHPFSWETLILLSLFSFLMALVALILPEKTNVAHHTILACGFIFSIAGMLWWQIEWNPYKIGSIKIWPWVASLLLCGIIFRYFPEKCLYLTSVSWPIVSAIIVGIPYFLPGKEVKDKKGAKEQKDEKKNKHIKNNKEAKESPKKASPILTLPEAATRQRLIILLLLHLTLSCWIQFCFTIQGWLQEYPSLLTNSFSESYVVTRLNLQGKENPRGAFVLQSMESFLESKIQDQRWQKIEVWMSGLNADKLEQEVKLRMPSLEENEWWSLKMAIAQREIGYKLDLFAIWSGPVSGEQTYHLKKSCEITQGYVPRGTSDREFQQAQPRPIANLTCSRASEPIFAEPASAFPWL